MLRRIPRGFLTIIAFLLGTAFLVPIIQANVQEWAKQRGYDQFMVQNWEPAVAWLAETTQTGWFLSVLGFFAGGSVFLWLDYWLRGRPSDTNRDESKDVALQQNEQKGEVLGAIRWRFLAPLYHFIAAKGHEGGVDYFGVQASGTNESDELISDFSGTVKSEVTGKEFPITVNDNRGNLVNPKGYGIPARHQFHWQVRFTELGKPLSASDFLRDFRRLTVRFKYNGQDYKRYFTPEEIETEVKHTEASLKKIPPRTSAGIIKLNDDSAAVAKRPDTFQQLRLRLAEQRSLGNVIKNKGGLGPENFGEWFASVYKWAEETRQIIHSHDPADAEWFKTLGAVPAQPRTAIHRLVTGNSTEQKKAYREIDFWLVKLEQLMERYSSKANG